MPFFVIISATRNQVTSVKIFWISYGKNEGYDSLDFPVVTIQCRGQIFSGSGYVKECHFLPYSSILDGVPEKKYNPEKTLADCFNFRNKIGMDIVLESLKFYRQRMQMISYRVTSVMKPYLEAIC